jgi:G6PDH family F420-dependent oxidoreductase
VSGEASIERFAPLADHLIAVQPDASLVDQWNATEGAQRIGDRARAVGQIPICWRPNHEDAVRIAHEQFRWFGGGWAVNSDLPTPAGFAAASQFVRPDDVADAIACGPDLDAVVKSVSAYWKAGFTDIALVQVGGETQEEFLETAAAPLLERLRAAAP